MPGQAIVDGGGIIVTEVRLCIAIVGCGGTTVTCGIISGGCMGVASWRPGSLRFCFVPTVAMSWPLMGRTTALESFYLLCSAIFVS